MCFFWGAVNVKDTVITFWISKLIIIKDCTKNISKFLFNMGGGYYDRDVIASGDGDGGNDVVGQQTMLNPGLDPKTYIEE